MMFTTHDSMRLSVRSEPGFAMWRGVELTNTTPLFILGVLYPRERSKVDMLFDLDMELVRFMETQDEARFEHLHLLLPPAWGASSSWSLREVSRLHVFGSAISPGPFKTVLIFEEGNALDGFEFNLCDACPAAPSQSFRFGLGVVDNDY